ncbi:hypothetical protein CNMCM5793_002027 [Aspergillus hiratsukae]|uniref:Secreted protein n=1 Tax=Aspergillus hiratsukae TaxID=1194566 RepID=A0A8H6V0H5_9EURO|nr:hypothetical protein CNMCM5793_002027 [Aspergillus hiratsukae]KAF7174043.1 hypothetical protein CNMCM6106_008141 [Aspergillus hiratsukae]
MALALPLLRILGTTTICSLLIRNNRLPRLPVYLRVLLVPSPEEAAAPACSSSSSLGSVSFQGSSWSPMRLVRGLLRKVPRLLAGSEVSVLG